MQTQWTKERNKLSVATMKGILTIQYNFKDMCCSEFFEIVQGPIEENYIFRKIYLVRRVNL